jgi:hypothetical protein
VTSPSQGIFSSQERRGKSLGTRLFGQAFPQRRPQNEVATPSVLPPALNACYAGDLPIGYLKIPSAIPQFKEISLKKEKRCEIIGEKNIS